MGNQNKGSFWDKPVKRKWLGVMAFLLVVAVVAAIGFSSWQKNKLQDQARNAMQNQLKAEARAIAHTIAVTSREDIIRRNYGDLRDYFGSIARETNVSYIIVMTPDGKAVVHTDAKYLGKTLQDPTSEAALEAEKTLTQDVQDRNIYDVAVPVMSLTQRVAIVRVGISYVPARQIFSSNKS